MAQVQNPYNHERNEHYLVRINRQFKCVCELCSCGRHKCPKPTVKGEFKTSYADQYKQYTVAPIQLPQRHTYNERHYNPESLKTNYQETYVPLEYEQPKLSASRLGAVGREVLRSQPFVGVTSYKEEYRPFKIENQNYREDRIEGVQKLDDSKGRASVKFEGQSAYKSQFHALPIQKLQRYKHPEYKNSRPFQGSSSYQDNYQGFTVQPMLQMPYNSARQKQIKFQGSSTYNNHYGSFKVAEEPKVFNQCRLDKNNIHSANFIGVGKHSYNNESNQQTV